MIIVLINNHNKRSTPCPETIPQIRPSFNRSLRLETRPELLSADTGALVQRELMDRSGLIDWLTERLHDPATPEFDPLSAVGSAADSTPAAGAGLARPVRRRPPASGSELAGGEPDPSGHGGLGGGPGAGVAADLVPTAGHAQPGGEPSGPAPGGDGAGVPSDRDDRRPAAKTGEKRTPRKKRRKKTMYLDVDGLPVEVHGHPPGSEWNGYYRQRMYHGLVASCAETGDLIDGEIFPGASYLGEKGAEVDAPGGGPLSGACVRLDDRADGCGVPGAGAAEGAGVERCALYRSNPQE